MGALECDKDMNPVDTEAEQGQVAEEAWFLKGFLPTTKKKKP